MNITLKICLLMYLKVPHLFFFLIKRVLVSRALRTAELNKNSLMNNHDEESYLVKHKLFI